jgi:hypothetical protein
MVRDRDLRQLPSGFLNKGLELRLRSYRRSAKSKPYWLSSDNGTGQPVRGFGFGVRDTVFRALGCTGLLCLFFGPNVESLPAYSVHVGDRSADPCQYCRSPIRQLQPAQCSISQPQVSSRWEWHNVRDHRCRGQKTHHPERPIRDFGASLCSSKPLSRRGRPTELSASRSRASSSSIEPPAHVIGTS